MAWATAPSTSLRTSGSAHGPNGDGNLPCLKTDDSAAHGRALSSRDSRRTRRRSGIRSLHRGPRSPLSPRPVSSEFDPGLSQGLRMICSGVYRFFTMSTPGSVLRDLSVHPDRLVEASSSAPAHAYTPPCECGRSSRPSSEPTNRCDRTRQDLRCRDSEWRARCLQVLPLSLRSFMSAVIAGTYCVVTCSRRSAFSSCLTPTDGHAAFFCNNRNVRVVVGRVPR